MEAIETMIICNAPLFFDSINLSDATFSKVIGWGAATVCGGAAGVGLVLWCFPGASFLGLAFGGAAGAAVPATMTVQTLKEWTKHRKRMLFHKPLAFPSIPT
jgi:hypothetical protein